MLFEYTEVAEHLSNYRKEAYKWTARTKRRSEDMDEFVEAVAKALLEVCHFLEDNDADGNGTTRQVGR
jgi:4-alpha-glucanotransferase